MTALRVLAGLELATHLFVLLFTAAFGADHIYDTLMYDWGSPAFLDLVDDALLCADDSLGEFLWVLTFERWWGLLLVGVPVYLAFAVALATERHTLTIAVVISALHLSFVTFALTVGVNRECVW